MRPISVGSHIFVRVDNVVKLARQYHKTSQLSEAILSKKLDLLEFIPRAAP